MNFLHTRIFPYKPIILLFLFGFYQYFSYGLEFHRQYPFFGHCLDFPTVPNFNIDRYMGRWYQVEKYYTIKDIGETCVWADYKKGSENGTFLIKNSRSFLFSDESVQLGKAKIWGKNNTLGRFSIKYRGVKEETPYWILYTDYDNFSLIFSCKDAGPLLNFQIAWVLSRKPKISNLFRGKIHRKLRSIGIRGYFLHKTFEFCPEFEVKR